MEELEKKHSKEHIQSLAELCIYEIYKNKFLNNQKERYSNQINFIKHSLINNSKLKNINKSLILIDQLKDMYNSELSSNFILKKEEKKILEKYNSYKEDLLKENSTNRQLLLNKQSDNFILVYQLQEKDNNIKVLNKYIDSLKETVYFKENKREITVNKKWGEYYYNVNLNDLSEKLMSQCQNFIQFSNKVEKREKEKIKLKKEVEFYKEAIKYFQNYIGNNNITQYENYKIKNTNKKNNKKKLNEKKLLTQTLIIPDDNKLSLFDNSENLFDENLIIDEEKNKIDKLNNLNYNIKNGNQELYSSVIFEEENKFDNLFKHKSHKITNLKKTNKAFKKSSKSIKNFLTVEELFDINNHEGKDEAIIDDELHSDDETVFEIKVKPMKKISIHYIPKIKMQVPKINLSQIEYNKQKVMNEADLYSLQRRNYKMQNMDENIKTMKKKIKKMKHICKLNKKKLKAFENHAKNMENNYKALKPLKIQSSLGGVKIPKIQKFFQNGNDENCFVNNIDDIDLGDDDSDPIEDEDTHNISNTETNAGTRISNSDKNNIIIKDKILDKFIDRHSSSKHNYNNGKKLTHYIKSSTRANSK